MNKIKELINDVINAIKEIIKSIRDKKNKRWIICLYFQNQLISKIKVDEDYKPMEHFYIVKLKNKKHLIGTNRTTQMMFKPCRYKMTDNDKRAVHIEVVSYDGIEMK